MERPLESMKSFANRIARTAYSSNSAQTLRLLRLIGVVGAGNDYDRFATEPPNPDYVGIWERKLENGRACFVRRLDTMAEWHFWANLGRIDAKGAKRRVVFIGESVARGYLYDPQFTPAMALQQILEPQFGGEVEVIDLARTNLTYRVRELAISALELEPDVIVIFSGNNWCVDFPGLSDLASTDEAMSKEGIAGVKRVTEEQIVRAARTIVNDVAATCASKGVPLVWIIPEFNLGDWRDPITSAPHLAEGLNEQWLLLLDEAQSALRDRAFDRAEELAHKMIEIDQGMCVAGFYILVECSKHKQDLEAERKYLELARDAVIWDTSRLVMPRTYGVTQAAMREETSKYKNYVVDMPALFKEYLNGGIPGRNLFIDYCHLTTEGIQVTMAATASCVLRALKGMDVPWYALGAEKVAPPRETEAEASFLAAVHNSHWWQPYDIIRYYCGRALSLSPHIAGLMLNYMELQTRRTTPALMGEPDQQISEHGSPLIHKYLLRVNDKRIDKLLLEAFVDALAEAGIEAGERLNRVRREEHSVTDINMNLLEFYYCSAAQQPQELQWLSWTSPAAAALDPVNPLPENRHKEAQYYKAYSRESRFYFVGEPEVDVRLCLTCRLPDTATGEDTIVVTLNGRPQAKIEIGCDWATWDINLPGEILRDGLNEVGIEWPMPQFASREKLEQVIVDLSERRFPEFYPIFGEIHSFFACDGRKEATTPLVEEEAATVAG